MKKNTTTTTSQPNYRPLAKERDKRCIPIARALLLALASDEQLKIGSEATISQDEAVKFYGDFYGKTVIPLLIEKDIALNEVGYIFSIMQQAVHSLSEITTKSLDMNRDIADARLYHVEDIDDLTIKHLDDILRLHEDVDKSGLDEKKKKKV